jgi:hypothetical protein
VQLFLEVARTGDPYAAANVATFFRDGIVGRRDGVRRDRVEAYTCEMPADEVGRAQAPLPSGWPTNSVQVVVAAFYNEIPWSSSVARH